MSNSMPLSHPALAACTALDRALADFLQSQVPSTDLGTLSWPP